MNFRKNLSIFLTTTLFLQSVSCFSVMASTTPAQGVSSQVQTLSLVQNTSTTTSAVAISNAKNYYSNVETNTLSSWAEVGAILSAYGSLNGYTLPTFNSPSKVSDYSSQILCGVSLSEDVSSLSSALAKMQQADGSFDKVGISDTEWAMIALRASGQSYDIQKALDYLNTYYTNTFTTSWGSAKPSNSFLGADDAAAMLLALSTITNNSVATSLKSSCINYLKSTELSCGAWAYGSGTTPNTCSTATVVSALESVSENMSSWTVNGNSPIDYIISMQASNGGFFYDDPAFDTWISGPDSMSTYESLTALGDYENGNSIWRRIPLNNSTPTFTIADLNAEIAKATDLKSSDYTTDSFAVLTSALQAGNNFVSSGSNNLDDLYSVLSALRYSIIDLVPSSSSDKTLTVSMSIVTDSGTNILSSSSYDVADGTTVFDLLRQVTTNNNITLEYTGSSSTAYVTKIGTLAEFSKGVKSGWNFSLNGVDISLSSGSINLTNGDIVQWHYTDDYTKSSNNVDANTPLTGSNYGVSTYLPYTKVLALEKASDISTILKSGLSALSKRSDLSSWESLFITLNSGNVTDKSLKSISETLDSNKGDYRLPTDLAKDALSLQIAQKDITNYNGCNLLDKICNFSNLGKQGLNGYIYSLLVLENQKTLPKDSLNTKDGIVKEILTYQNTNGGFSLAKGGNSETDITAMTLSALAPYKSEANVDTALGKALAYLQNQSQTAIDSSESLSQIIIGLCHLGISPDDSNFIYNDQTLVKRLLQFQTSKGEFAHTITNNASDGIATEQALLALQSYKNLYAGKTPIYVIAKDTKFTSTPVVGENKANAIVLEKAVKLGLVLENSTIEDLQKPISREDFITLLLKSKNLKPVSKPTGIFKDVASDEKTGYVEKASLLGYVSGVGNGNFNPNTAIKYEDVATILSKSFVCQKI